MANYPQELAQDAVCQNHTGHMTGLWCLPTRPLKLNTNNDDDDDGESYTKKKMLTTLEVTINICQNT